MQNTQSMDHMEDQASNVQTGEERENTRDVLNEAETVLRNMKREDGMDAALEQAKGVFLVPDFGRGAFVFGGRGGQGVVLTKDGGDWNGPAFFNFGAVSAGAQGGVAAGEVAMLLMTDKAVKSFKQDHNFALNADAGLTLLDWSNVAQGSYGKGDVLFWSSTALSASAMSSVTMKPTRSTTPAPPARRRSWKAKWKTIAKTPTR